MRFFRYCSVLFASFLLVGCAQAPAKESFTVTWKNYDDSILFVEKFEEGRIPTYEHNNPTRPSTEEYRYVFSGWSPEITAVTSDVTYRAQYDTYQRGNQLTIKYTLYEPENNSLVEEYEKLPEKIGSFSETKIYKTDAQVSLNGTLNEGYSFAGWYYDGLILSSEANYSCKMRNKDVTLEARISYTNYTLSLSTHNKDNGLVLIKNENNNNYQESMSATKYYEKEVTIAAFSNSTHPFLGWFEGNSLKASHAVYSFIMPNRDYTLEARWDYFTINYILNGGTNNSKNPTHFCSTDSKIVFQDPTRPGYRFLGWKLGNSYATSFTPSSILNDIEVEAERDVITYNVEYILNGGTNNDQNPSNYNIEDAIELSEPTRMGYQFEGWYLDGSNYTSQVLVLGNGLYGDLTLTAKWNPITYAINYHLNGGTNNENNPNSYTIEDDLTLYDATKDDMDFDGWYDNPNFEGEKIDSIPLGSVGVKDLYAKWVFSVALSNFKYELDGTNVTITGLIDKEVSRLVIPDIVTNGEHRLYIKKIGKQAFYFNTFLTSVELPSTVEEIDSFAFSGCTNLQEVKLPSNLKIIGYGAFKSCSLLRNIEFPDLLLKIDDDAFYKCESLSRIYLKTSVNYVGNNSFAACTSLEEFIVSELNETYSAYDGVLYSKDKKNLIFCPASKNIAFIVDDCVESLSDYAFYYSSITSITLSTSISSIGVYTFNHCNNLKELVLPNGITNIPSSIINSSSVETLFISESINSITGNSFSCNSLKEIRVDKNNNYYHDVDGILFATASNKLLNYPRAREGIYVVPEKVTSIGEMAFDGCLYLNEVSIPDDVKDIGRWAFMSCGALESVKLSNEITQIAKSTFEACASLKAITIPQKVKAIGEYAFSGCNKLRTFNYNGTVEERNLISLGDKWYSNSIRVVHCTNGDVKLP